MRFLTDENISNVRSVLEEKSFDKDFGSLVFHFAKKSGGVVLLRLRNERADNMLVVMNQLLKSKLKLADRFTVVSEDQIKSRGM